MTAYESSVIVKSARFVNVPGALNFRDMGGYITADGRSTRWKVLFRSGTTHAISTQDLILFDRYGIRRIFDLRSSTERHDYPSRLSQLRAVAYDYIEHDLITGDIFQALGQASATAEDSSELMLDFYRKMPTIFSRSFQQIFSHLVNGELPLVFNCSAGKDRTGVAAALILAALGVPRKFVLEDYLLTEQCFAESCALLIGDHFADISPVVWEPIMRSNSSYLTAMFEELMRNYGSIDLYLSKELGLSSADLTRMKNHLLAAA